jgi:hypothetical protein
LIIPLGEKHKLWSSSLCSFLQPPVTSSLFGSSITQNICLWIKTREEMRPSSAHHNSGMSHNEELCRCTGSWCTSGSEMENINVG